MKFFALAAASLVVLLAGDPASAQLAVGMRLENAGFKMRQANTPQKMARLRSVPPHRFIARKKNGVSYYLYADPDDCKCAFVGNQQALDAYRDMPALPPQPDNVPARGVPLVADMMHDMAQDGGVDMDDIFHPGF